MLLCAHGLCPAKQAEPRLLNLTSTSFAQTLASARFANALAAAQPIIVCPFSSEAVLLTEEENYPCRALFVYAFVTTKTVSTSWSCRLLLLRLVRRVWGQTG